MTPLALGGHNLTPVDELTLLDPPRIVAWRCACGLHLDHATVVAASKARTWPHGDCPRAAGWRPWRRNDDRQQDTRLSL